MPRDETDQPLDGLLTETGPIPLEELYEVPPDTASCEPGVLIPEFKARVVAYLNGVRALHGLPLLRYEFADDEQVQAAALIFVANGQLTHNPSSSFHCYSEAGAVGACVAQIEARNPTRASIQRHAVHAER